MAGILNYAPSPVFRPLLSQRVPKRGICFKASTEVSQTPADSSVKEESSAGASTSTLTFSPPPDFKPAEPKPFKIRADRRLDILGASLASLFRLGTGAFVSGLQIEGELKFRLSPEKPIEIYEFESCPFCKKVREIVAVLDLDVLFYPCPKNGPNFRPKVAQMGGKQQFPYMVDTNTGVAMYESDDIIKYLVNKYGDGKVPLMLSLGLLTTLTAGFAMIGRVGKGGSYTPAKVPPKPLELWAYEPSPFCKVVREVLVELELPHILHSCARGSPKRQELFQRVGHFQVPYLEDPNTWVQMFESADIVDYLRATYSL